MPKTPTKWSPPTSSGTVTTENEGVVRITQASDRRITQAGDVRVLNESVVTLKEKTAWTES